MNAYSAEQFGVMRIVLVVGFLVVTYMLYNLTVSIYDNYQIEQAIAEFEETNARLSQENKKKLEDFQYYTSREYMDKTAKTNLGLINPDEQVIIIPSDDFVMLTEEEDLAMVTEQIMDSWSTPKKWWKFFFDYNPYKV